MITYFNVDIQATEQQQQKQPFSFLFTQNALDHSSTAYPFIPQIQVCKGEFVFSILDS